MAQDGDPILERADGRLWRVQPVGRLTPAPRVRRVRAYRRRVATATGSRWGWSVPRFGPSHAAHLIRPMLANDSKPVPWGGALHAGGHRFDPGGSTEKTPTSATHA